MSTANAETACHPAQRQRRTYAVIARPTSGLLHSAIYCRRRLTADIFSRRLKVLVDDKVLRAKAKFERGTRLERWRRKDKSLSNDKRSKAVQAFWAMQSRRWTGAA